ncbi:MAG TPA: hypothetical protein PKY59_14515 [Pyrinomonadaceae bacterium]|nr:hypothetical protein [Pyrinomonadaceae bacterium]
MFNKLNFVALIGLLFISTCVFAQNPQIVQWENQLLNEEGLSKKESKSVYNKYDFSKFWTQTENSSVLGFIGNDYQRIRVKIISAVKDKSNSDIYKISGKSLVKNNLCSFSGTMKISKIRLYDQMRWGVDDEYKNKGIKKQGILIGDYKFAENGCSAAGIFEGRFASYWYLDKNGKIKYDDIETESDGYSNNQFAGIWKSNSGKTTKICNWGDYRIPLSGDLDIGAGEFSPDEKYLKSGWQNYHDAYFGNNEKARAEENRIWWK